jgi:hypothetical protein
MPFTLSQCKGHFENYPIVPFVFVANCVLREIFNSLENRNTYEIDSLEGYASRPCPLKQSFWLKFFNKNPKEPHLLQM